VHGKDACESEPGSPQTSSAEARPIEASGEKFSHESRPEEADPQHVETAEDQRSPIETQQVIIEIDAGFGRFGRQPRHRADCRRRG
jgi:hypothetical protein